MALTKAQEIALYTILEVPYATVHNRVISEGLLVEPHSVTGSPSAAKTHITAHLADVATDAALEAVLTGLLDEWIDLGTDTTAIEGGAVGNVQGLTTTISGEREEIRRQVLIIVPFYRYHEQFQRQGVSVMVIR